VLPLLVLVGALLVLRSAAAWRIERRTARRLPRGPLGVVVGAEPLDLTNDGARHATLLVHGFGDTPQSLAELARRLHAHGSDVRVPLLPGHGRTLEAFARSRAEDWLGAARVELRALRARYDQVTVVGLSMGGAIATILAAEDPEVAALVLLAPYLELPRELRGLVRFDRLVGACVPYLTGGSDRSIHDPAERAKNLAYRVTTARLVRELGGLADRARAALPRVTAPTLIVQSREDNRLAPGVAERALESLGAREKALVWVEGCGHIVTVDYGRERVFQAVAEWLARAVGTSTAPAPAPSE
jgi:carboxylesterase